ncbi:DNA-3-methyladenine glycosylase I [Camelliibacillus cellulosilyticus]|uniref:DNA-3-methyladenine glycosylase I n=1 Tax=Camelliibacillus cellulosilyticus TaxID=2174486 RepID=A0ABV9GNR0_9BACL
MVKRCAWCADDPLLIDYHDHEWGVRTTDDRELFEYLILELFQSGLSWRTILHKREALRTAFDGFDFHRIGDYDSEKVDVLMHNAAIIRNRRKIEATIKNANVCQNLIAEHGSFSNYLAGLPESSEEKKQALSRVFYHVGPTVAESFCQAAGLIPVPHEAQCFLYKKEF